MDNKLEFTFPIIIEYADDGINISFPDLEEAYSCAHSEEEVLKNAEEVLILTLKSRIEDNENIPKSTDLKDITLYKNQYTSIVKVFIDSKVQYDKKTLTIPHDVNEAATKAGVNFSKVLHKALLKELESNIVK